MLGFGNGRNSSCWVLEMGDIAHAGFWKWEK